jgi:hypothetical protein
MQVIAMFQMFGRGQIDSLDDPLAKYCAGFSMMTEYNITLRQMAAQVCILVTVSDYCSSTFNSCIHAIIPRCLDCQERPLVVLLTSSTSVP